MYGTFKDAFGPLRARLHEGSPGDAPLLNIPVTTIPVMRAPFHLSYILWLAGKSRFVAKRYLGTGLSMCRLRGIAPSYLLHSLDFAGHGDHKQLDFFPGMNITWDQKRPMLDHLMTKLKQSFDVMPMRPYCEDLLTEPSVASAGA